MERDRLIALADELTKEELAEIIARKALKTEVEFVNHLISVGEDQEAIEDYKRIVVDSEILTDAAQNSVYCYLFDNSTLNSDVDAKIAELSKEYVRGR